MGTGSNPGISRLNSYLEQIRSQLTECYQYLVVNKQTVTPDAIKNKFFGIEDSGETLKGLAEYQNIRKDANQKLKTLNLHSV